MTTILDRSTCVLVTGFTGFLGKVIVEELCRQQLDGIIPCHRILVLIRPKKAMTARERFLQITKAICFSKLPRAWHDMIEVVEGDLSLEDFGLSQDVHSSLEASITHIIHCAASVAFDLPLIDATRANVHTSMNMLRLARGCPNLIQMIDTSTAYVSLPGHGMIHEALHPLPEGLQPEDFYRLILEGAISESQLLRMTGHSNTYTISKCLAEHLLHKKRGALPLTIVRPSIISAALHHPFPGYIDSYAALAGFITLYGTGMLHVIEGSKNTGLDVVPVDIVAKHIIHESRLSDIDAKPSDCFKIVHSTAGMQDSCLISDIEALSTRYFRANPAGLRVYQAYIGPRNMRFQWHKLTTQTLPHQLAGAFFKISGNKAMSLRMDIVKKGIKQIDQTFPFFLGNSFDFATSRRIDEHFSSTEYLQISIEGVHRHLIRRELFVE